MDLLLRLFNICTVFVICIAVGVEGVLYGEACTGPGTGDCTETVNIVCDTTCKCTTDSFRKDDTECATKIALTQSCATGQPADQCADTNAECVGTPLTCSCKTAHFVNKDGACDPSVGLDGTCDGTDMATDQCSVINTECRDDGAGSKCLCIASHFSDGTACQPKVAGLNTTCDGAVSATDQCSTAGTECKDDGTGTNTNRCLCKPTYYPDGSTCLPRSGVIKVAMLQYMYVVPFIVSMMTLLR